MGWRSRDEELRDIVADRPMLVDSSGEPTGIRLIRWIGSGGMSTVFLGELDATSAGSLVSALAPRLLAIKLQRLSTERQLERINLSPMDFARKELVALARVMDRKPPTEFVVGYYGSGTVEVDTAAGARHIPWLALEYVDGGAAGNNLEDRVLGDRGGLDPVRALRLARGILEGVDVLHGAGILHRDLKPGNVFVTGPVDDETPKIADCGIARVEGLSMATIAALTPAYAGPEQSLSLFDPTRQNPLVGTWSDVHAAAALLWFILAGEHWCRGDTDAPWHGGHRRSLSTADRLHEGFADSRLVLQLDAVFEVAASHRVPDIAWQSDGAPEYERIARLRFRESMFEGAERYPDIPTLRRELLPLLQRAADAWLGVAARSGRPSTLFRETRVTSMDSQRRQATVEEIAGGHVVGTGMALHDMTPAEPGGVMFLADGKALARFGDRLVYFVGGKPHKVAVPPGFVAEVAMSRWLGRGPAGGFALIGPRHVALIRGGEFARMPLPSKPDGVVGDIAAVIADGRTFALVTEETDDSDGPELWLARDEHGYLPPLLLPMSGSVHALARGPFGSLVVGSLKGKRGRAMRVSFDGQATVFTTGVHDRPPLTVAVAGAMHDSWAAGGGVVLGFCAGGASEEQLEHECPGAPVAMALDVVGVPWLLTERAVLRRDGVGSSVVWRTQYQRAEDRPPLVGIGFDLDGAIVMDARGGGARIRPHDVDAWHPTELPGRPNG